MYRVYTRVRDRGPTYDRGPTCKPIRVDGAHSVAMHYRSIAATALVAVCEPRARPSRRPRLRLIQISTRMSLNGLSDSKI